MTLDLRITPGSATPIYRQIVHQVRHGVAAGTRRRGDPLPSIRDLAEQLVINPNTVAKAYNELVRDGIIESRPGLGYFVASPRQVYSDGERRRRLAEALGLFLGEVLVLNFSPDEIRAALDGELKRMRAKSSGRGKDHG